MKIKNCLKLILSSLFVFSLFACNNTTSNSSSSLVSSSSTNVSSGDSVSTSTSQSTSSNVTTSTSTSVVKERIDYVSQTHIYTPNWKTKSFLNDGVGVVSLYKTVDGDTAHFTEGSNKSIIQIRFNGVNTPESTGKIEPWGHAASEFTKENLLNAKTIVIETEYNNNNGGPVADSTGTRYLAWVWVSDKPVEEEDGSTLRLLNLMLVDGSYSATKSISGSVYAQTFVDCDLQAQQDKIRIWSNEEDPDYYYGTAINTDIKEICTNPETYLGKRVAFEGIITRTLGLNAYVQAFYDDDETGVTETYGLYMFTSYVDYGNLFTKGNLLRIVGVVSEYPAGSNHIQIVDISYNKYFPDAENDMVLISTGHTYEAIEATSPSEVLNFEHYCTLVKLSNITVTGGYGGRDEGYDTNAMTLYAKTSSGEEFNIRIDSSTFIKDQDGNTITTYTYFVGKTFDISGMVGYYESISGRQTYQLMLVATSDLIYL